MKKSRKIWAMVAAGAMILSLSATALAAPAQDGEQTANGHTTIGIMETQNDPSLVSFEVPLYVTLAAVNNKADVVAPGPNVYMIKNTSSNQSNNPYPIAVTQVEFQTVAGGTWGTTTAASPTGKNMNLSIGGVPIPTLAAGGNTTFLNTNNAGSVFYDATTQKPKKIAPDATLDIPIVGKISTTAVTADAPAAPQFKVKYTISAIGSGDTVIGKPYVGNDSVEAGFGSWNGTGFDPVPDLVP